MRQSPTLLREARKRAGLTQAELARRSNRSQQSIARWEAGKVEPGLKTLEELVRACGWELVTDLGRADLAYESEIRRQLRLSPPARLRSALRADFDPKPILRELEGSGLRYVLVGGLGAFGRGGCGGGDPSQIASRCDVDAQAPFQRDPLGVRSQVAEAVRAPRTGGEPELDAA
ncbi:MAG TPA: helix-turn-helix transcriptional regulator [Actinomycetes bacterium]|nr:helix-turn-helix transcriptional regulator [Actinomycetes bacterium]